MNRKKFFYLLFLLNVTFVFVKIYQHNLVIKLNYEKQRLEIKKTNLKHNKNYKLVKLYKLRDFKRIKNIAINKLRLKELKLSQVITLTNKL